MDAFEEFEAFSELADRLIGEMSKDQVVDCARVVVSAGFRFRRRALGLDPRR